MSSTDAFQSGIRVQIGLALRAGPLTAQEIAKALGRPTGAIFGSVRRMTQEGLLVPDADPPGRGTRYQLTPAAEAALRAALSEREQPGTLQAGQQLLLVEPPALLADALEVFAREEVAGSVDWAAEISGGWLLALSPDLDDSVALMALRVALEDQQIRSRPLTLERLLPGSELRSRAEWLREVTDRPPR